LVLGLIPRISTHFFNHDQLRLANASTPLARVAPLSLRNKDRTERANNSNKQTDIFLKAQISFLIK
jgi:hypothetical protein